LHGSEELVSRRIVIEKEGWSKVGSETNVLQIVRVFNLASAYQTPGHNSCEHLGPSTETTSTSAYYTGSNAQKYLLVAREVAKVSCSDIHPSIQAGHDSADLIGGGRANPAVIAGRLLSDEDVSE
jgi:hypothetical protein